MSPLTTRAEDGKVEFTELGGFVFLLVGSTLLALLHAGAHAIFPNLNATNGGIIATFILVPFQFGKDENWAHRARILVGAFLAYAWCVSLMRVLVGGDMTFYAWASLAVFQSAIQWWGLDWARRQRSGPKAGG